MNQRPFDALARRAAEAVSRRRSLLVLSGAAIGTSRTRPESAAAGKTGKKVKKKCRRQVEPCRQYWIEYCGGSDGCEAELLPCCEHFARCHGVAAWQCMDLGT